MRSTRSRTPSRRCSREHGIRQLHLAETEKYAHVTYFFNGGREDEWEGETRILVPSPKDVATYDQKPEMSAAEVTRRFEEEIGDGYRFAIVNFANPDMVGHTGVIPAVIRAVETVDACLGRVVAAVERARRCLPRHRRSRQRRADARAGRHEPAHRAHDQPGAAFRSRSTASKLADGGTLSDLVPTCLNLLGIPPSAGMTGRDLVTNV